MTSSMCSSVIFQFAQFSLSQNFAHYFSGGFGGLNALAILVAIKFKIIIVASIIAISVYYYTKFVSAKKCAGGLLRDGSPVYPADAS